MKTVSADEVKLCVSILSKDGLFRQGIAMRQHRQGDFRLKRLGFLVDSLIAGDPNMTWDPLIYSGQGFPWLSKALGVLGHGSKFINVCGYNALRSFEGQGDFPLRRLDSLHDFMIGSLISKDSNTDTVIAFSHLAPPGKHV
ncbi:hypothetical protein TNCV_2625361 [Trichonephila clavipes]|nr:hypothetical protein TNCV_2625361 [Trichonephila clavipes]